MNNNAYDRYITSEPHYDPTAENMAQHLWDDGTIEAKFAACDDDVFAEVDKEIESYLNTHNSENWYFMQRLYDKAKYKTPTYDTPESIITLNKYKTHLVTLRQLLIGKYDELVARSK